MKSNDSNSSVLVLPDGTTSLAASIDTQVGAQIVFIDGSLPDAQALAQGVSPGVVAVVLDPSQDGVQQIADYLTSHNVQNAAAIDIVAHGADGVVELGSTRLTSATIADHQSQLAQIGNALQPGGDIQLYGCDVAQDAGGVAFLQQLSQATGGANIAASSHLVGSAAGGGSWNLDVDVGKVDVASPFTSTAIANFSSELLLSGDQVFFSASNGETSASNVGNRIERIGVSGSSAATSPFSVADGSQNNNTLSALSGVVVDAPLKEYFTASLNANTNAWGVYKGSTDGGGSVSSVYTAPNDANNDTINSVALDQPDGLLYFIQFDPDPAKTGIFKMSVNGGAATAVVTGIAAPENLALDLKDNLVFFTETDGASAGLGGVNNLDVASLSGGAVTTLLSEPFVDDGSGGNNGLLLHGLAVDPNSSNVYFTGDNGGVTASNGIFKVHFSIAGATVSIGSVSTLYSGANADFPSDIAIDPSNGIFFSTGATAATLNGNPGDVAGIFEGSLTANNSTALTQVYSLSQNLSLAAGSFDTSASGLVLETTPTVSASGTVTFAQGGTSVALASSATVADRDGQNLASATVAISSGFITGDTLTATTAGTNINTSFSNGTLTLTGSSSAGGDTLAHFQQVLESVKFSSTSNDPTQHGADSTRSIDWTINDGIIASATPTTTLDIHAAYITAGATVSYTGGGSAVVLDGSLVAGDSVGTDFTSATVTVGNFLSGDTLNFSPQNNISESSFNNGTLVLTGSSSFTNYQAALQSITYSFTPGQDPTGGNTDKSRTISWVVNDGTVVSPSATSTLNINHAAPTITASGTVTYPELGSPVQLDSGVAVTDPDSPTLTSATVSVGNFLSSDILQADTTGLAITQNYNTATGILTLTGTDTVVDYQHALSSITFSNSGDPTAGNTDTSRTISWLVSDGVASSSVATSSVATLCFCAGTRIATPHGEVAVECLAIGDPVLTIDGRWLPIRWIGTGHSLLPIGRRTDATPVIVRAGALADGVPRRDLRLTKGHSLYLDGMLIPVENLINHESILWDDAAQSVTVYHLELDTHEVLLADDAPAESYRDDGNRLQFHNVNPDWGVRPPLKPCAPIVTSGAALAALWQRLLERAGPQPAMASTGEPDLHLLVNGVRLEASSVLEGVHSFELMGTTNDIQLASRSGIPSELGVNGDNRRLGVAVERIVLRQSGMMLEIVAQSPLLSDGFHEFEADQGFRWTNGAALLPSRALDAFAEASLTMEVHVGCTARYPAQSGKLRFAA